MPASDPENELPLFCYKCEEAVIWGNGLIMIRKKWNSYYDRNGHLLDEDNNPSSNNPDWIGHK